MAKSKAEKDIEKKAQAVSRGVGFVSVKKRREIAEANGYTVEKAISEVEEMVEFCKLAGFLNQISALLTLKNKLCGFLSEQVEIYGGEIDIVGAMAEAEQRRLPPREEPETVDLVLDEEGVFS